MKTLVLILIVLGSAAYLAGCSSLPTMRYCEKVEYKRDGSKIHIEAECQAPVGGSIPGV
jgi:hypothetical protein